MNINEKRRLNLLMISKGYLKKRELADALDVSPSYLSQLLSEPGKKGSRGIGERRARKIERSLNLGEFSLDELSKDIDVNNLDTGFSGGANLGPRVNLGPEVPVITWRAAGRADLAIELLGEDEVIAWKGCPVKKYSKQTFALLVGDDSMTTPYGEKSYPKGCFIYVDPEQEAQIGDRVVAKIDGQESATFRQLAESNGSQFLMPLNERYPTIHEEFLVVGLVVGKYQDD